MVRVLTFQSQEVVDSLIHNCVYKACDSLKRENRDYSLDIAQLKGAQPIWCFKIDEPLNLHAWYRGNTFIYFKSELSTTEEKLCDLVLMEFEVNEEDLKLGLTHNSSPLVMVTSELRLENLVMLYQLNQNESETGFHVRHLTFRRRLEPLLADGFKTLTAEEYKLKANAVNNKIPLEVL